MLATIWRHAVEITRYLNEIPSIGILAFIAVVILIVILLHATICIIRGQEYYLFGMRFGRVVDDQDAQFQPSFDQVKTIIKHRGTGWLEILRPNKDMLGKRLFKYKGLYPIKLDSKSNIPSIDRDIFSDSIDYFIKEENFDLLAILDLIYLREINKDFANDIVKESDVKKYEQLISKYKLEDFRRNYNEYTPQSLSEAKRVVEGIGKTFGRECGIEILLHDVRNPIHSIIAAVHAETVSGRHIGDPSTRFVVHYLENQGEGLIPTFDNGSKIGYEKEIAKGKTVKATTIPIYDDIFGLVGLLCFNIDVDMFRAASEKNLPEIINRLIQIDSPTPKFEIDDASNHCIELDRRRKPAC